MPLLDPQEWTDRVFTGTWTPAHGGTAPVTSPVTGAAIGSIGSADADDVTASVREAARAQRAWAAAPYTERAAVRRAGDLFAEYTDEIVEWSMREAGSARGKAAFEVHLAGTEAHESAALASQPAGEVLRSEQPRLSLSRRVPVGVAGVIAPFNFPLILGLRSVAPALALGNAVVLNPTRARPCPGVWSSRRSCVRPVCPRGSCTCCPGEPRPGCGWWRNRPCA